jgi:hypothetical protein
MQTWMHGALLNTASYGCVLTGKFDISIPAASLPTGGAVTVTATLTKTGAPVSTTTITVPINGKPKCSPTAPAEDCLEVLAVSETFPDATYSALPVGFEDDDVTPLRCELQGTQTPLPVWYQRVLDCLHAGNAGL